MRYILISPLLLFLNPVALIAQPADAGPDTSLCVNFYTMQGSPVPPGGTGQWVSVMGCAVIYDPSDPVTQLVGLCIGTSVLSWVVTEAGGSPVTSDDVVITVYDPNMPIANAGMDQTVVGPQNSAVLNGAPVPIWPATCWWTILTGSSIISDQSDPNATANDLGYGDNIFVWTCENGPCWSSPTVDTVVIQMMQLPTGIGGVADENTTWTYYDARSNTLRFTSSGVVKHLQILDAQGRILLSGTNQLGTLPDGVYVVRAERDGRWRTQRIVVAR